jgi:hypothetical protein
LTIETSFRFTIDDSRKQFAWIQDSCRIQGVLDLPEQGDADRTMFLHHPLAMQGADTMMMAQASTGLDDCFGSRDLARSPELQLIPVRHMPKNREEE